MKAIHRFIIELMYHQTIGIPTGFRVRHLAPARTQHEDIVDQIDIWAEVDTTKETVPIDVWIVGTGHPLPPDEVGPIFVGTAVMPDNYVWHVFVGVPT